MPRHTFSDVSVPVVMAWGDCLGPVVVTTYLSACGCGTLFPSVRKIPVQDIALVDHPWRHLQGQHMCKNQEFGSSQRTTERRELSVLHLPTVVPATTVYSFLPICKPEGQNPPGM